MTELNKKILGIKKRFNLEKGSVHTERNAETGQRRYYLTEEQMELFYDIKNLFRSMGWEISFQNYKELKISEESALDQSRCGTPVLVRPAEEGMTYFGILLGYIAEHPSASIEGNTVTLGPGLHNPAILIPELKRICFGYESWWHEIDGPGELEDAITDGDIESCWYMKLLREMA